LTSERWKIFFFTALAAIFVQHSRTCTKRYGADDTCMKFYQSPSSSFTCESQPKFFYLLLWSPFVQQNRKYPQYAQLELCKSDVM
jgi:hypothetical protein